MQPWLCSFLILSLCYCEIHQILCKFNIVQDQEVTDNIDLELSLGVGKSRGNQLEGKFPLYRTPSEVPAEEHVKTEPREIFPIDPKQLGGNKRRVVSMTDEGLHSSKRFHSAVLAKEEIDCHAECLPKQEQLSEYLGSIYPPIIDGSPFEKVATHQPQPWDVDFASQTKSQIPHPAFNHLRPYATHPNVALSPSWFGRQPFHDTTSNNFYKSNYPHLFSQGQGASTTGMVENKLTSSDPTWLGQQLREHYSCQILDWIPPDINEAAALASYSIASKFFFKAPLNVRAMHESHSILIPFLYKLMKKPISQNHWKSILSVWNRFWKAPMKADGDVYALKKFVWISDLISESTLPEIYQDAEVETRYDFHLMTDEVLLIRWLSDTRREKQFYNTMRESVTALASKFDKEYSKTDRVRLEWLTETQLHDLVLNNLKERSASISSTISEFVYNGQGVHFCEINPFLRTCQEIFLLEEEKRHSVRFEQFSLHQRALLKDIDQRNFGLGLPPVSVSKSSMKSRIKSLQFLDRNFSLITSNMNFKLPKIINNYFN
ncbi:hypothetical protein PGT21_022402 [Puccinia graminis f. sp. tritici]|uniref:Uncharacterized protein n=1 Tax=Puccinia graminis f. sp. tritici TaxID=56615 RepID=A0A5B0LPJ7_PUCGR|nr:hypothetical protein PGT21_022402 [Puccinia graminis f. sp. tritici]KAA1111425.1 hypothetical protein PGTUg99_003180 [Puccinia graminis f. sp. tritici]